MSRTTNPYPRARPCTYRDVLANVEVSVSINEQGRPNISEALDNYQFCYDSPYFCRNCDTDLEQDELTTHLQKAVTR